MNILLILWIVLSIILFGLFIWTNIPLIEQKKAWKKFAAKNKLKYYPGGFLKSPFVVGEFDDVSFRLFSEEQYTQDITKRRFTSVLEWIVPGMPTSGIVASKDLSQIVSLANVSERIKNLPGEWDKKDFIVAERSVALMPYLTDERIKTMRDLIKVKNARFLYVFDTSQAVMRIETNDPLLNDGKITPVYRKMRKAVEILKPTDEDFENVDKAYERLQRQATGTDEPHAGFEADEADIPKDEATIPKKEKSSKARSEQQSADQNKNKSKKNK
mgnify:CR=1 FL=1